MATTDDISLLRSLVNDTEMPYEFDAPTLGGYIDAADGDVNTAAGVVWGIKAAKLAGLADVTEGSSSRKLSQLHTQALTMASHFGGATQSSSGRSGTRPIMRA